MSGLSPLAVAERFAGLRVLVVGEAMLDTYLRGSSQRICREAPVPIVALAERLDAPGGAANTAVNARHLGAAVSLLSVVGDDAAADRLAASLRARGVGDEHLLRDPARRTLAKQRIVAGRQLLVRLDEGSTGTPGGAQQQRVVERLVDLFHRHDAVVVSDYGYGVLTPRVIRALAALQAGRPRVIAVDSKDLRAFRAVGVTAAKPNYEEALGLLPAATRTGGSRIEAIARHGQRLLGSTGARIAAVTLDTEGALFFERGRPAYRTYAQPADHARAAGAGDTFVAALALALAAGGDLAAAAEVASAAAAVVVGQEGTASCAAEELRERLSPQTKYSADPRALAPRLARYRHRGRRLVLTSGCFDLLHRGHVTYLNAAKGLGDVLIVGLNTDAGVRRLKGPGRPVNALEDRAQVLAALSCVDHIVAFDEDTPTELVRAVRPDVFAKGGDYTAARLPEADVVRALGGAVRILPFVDDRSTTAIIERIRAAAGGPDLVSRAS